ncbi:MAG: hypothetical protein AAGG51_24025 [Cyanobacteria bacterium P01_G01_bin.54]
MQPNFFYTSLFKIIDRNPKEGTLLLTDLLGESDEPLSVININLSKTAKSNYVVFSRILPTEAFKVFSGMFAAFDGSSDRALLKRYKVMKKRVKAERECRLL